MTAMIQVEQGVIGKFKKELIRYGFNDFCFGLLNVGDEEIPCLSSLTDLDVKKYRQQKYLIASSKRALDIRNGYINSYAFFDKSFNASSLKLGPELWKCPQVSNKPSKKINKLFDESNVNGVVNWKLETKYHWFSYFNLFPSESSMKVRDVEELEMLLIIYSQYFTVTHIEELNPLTNFSIISKKSSDIVCLISDGKSINEIAKLVHLTERGVHYHIDRLKEMFCCNNRSQLVNKAHKLGLLS